MVIFGNDIIPTTFRYKVSGFSGERQAKSKIGDSYGIYKFASATATGGRWLTPPPPSNICSQNQHKTVYSLR